MLTIFSLQVTLYALLIHKLIDSLHDKITLKKLGTLEYFLGIEIKHLAYGNLLLIQSKYICDLLAKANMSNANEVLTPIRSTCKLSKHLSSPLLDSFTYRSMVGALQYVTVTRPYITFSVNKACQYMISPMDSHWTTIKRILRYLSGNIDHGFLISPTVPSYKHPIYAYSDSDWTSDPDDRRSTYGSCIFLSPKLVS